MTVKRSGFWFVVVVGLLALIAIFNRPQPAPKCDLNLAGNKCISLEVVNTPANREQGLSARESIGKNDGMLFVFEQPQLACMWMKDMKFAIDMVWLNDDQKITKIENDVRPATFPAVFCADTTKYVLELAPGVAAKAGLKIDQRLSF